MFMQVPALRQTSALQIDEKTVACLNTYIVINSARTKPFRLRSFLAVARHGSFGGAASERGIDPSAFSHVIRSFEQALDVRLFHRTTRSVHLTEAGHKLLHRIGPSLDELFDALDDARTSATISTGSLRLNVPRIANELILAPLVAPFLSRYPGITLEIASFDGLADIVVEGFDAGIRRDRRVSPGMVTVPIAPARRFAVVGSPAHFADRVAPLVPDDLGELRCIWSAVSKSLTLRLGVRTGRPYLRTRCSQARWRWATPP